MDPETQSQLKQKIAAIIAQKDLAIWVEIFKDKDCCVEPVLSFAEACASDHIKARELIVDLKTHDNGVQRQIGSAIKLSKSAPKYEYIGAQLGQHNQQVLESLGFDDKAIKAAKDAGAFG